MEGYRRGRSPGAQLLFRKLYRFLTFVIYTNLFYSMNYPLFILHLSKRFYSTLYSSLNNVFNYTYNVLLLAYVYNYPVKDKSNMQIFISF